MQDGDRIVLVDGYAQIYRSFFAIRGLTAPDGRPSNAIFGVARFMLSLDSALPHTVGALVLDKGKPQHRLELLPEYKANRPAMPNDLRAQIGPIREWATALGWPILEVEGVEADDLIAAVVALRGSHSVAIVSPDKDLGQLVQPGVTLLIPGKKGRMVALDADGIRGKFGVAPEFIPDYLALVGDSADNIAGVQGIGPKTAVALINQHGGIEQILSRVASIEKQSWRDKIVASAELMRRNLLLVRLDETPPPGWGGVSQLRRREPDWQALVAMAKDYGFRSLTSTLEKRWSEARNPTLF